MIYTRVYIQARTSTYRHAHVNIIIQARADNNVDARVYIYIYILARTSIILYIGARANHIMSWRANILTWRANICSWREGKKAVGDGSYRENSCSAEKVILEISDKLLLLTALRAAPIDSNPSEEVMMRPTHSSPRPALESTYLVASLSIWSQLWLMRSALAHTVSFSTRSS